MFIDLYTGTQPRFLGERIDIGGCGTDRQTIGTPKFIFVLTSDSLLTCHNNFDAADDDTLILDTTNPGFTGLMAQWIGTLDSIEADALLGTSALHITIRPEVSSATVDKVKTAINECGIEKFSMSNFDIPSRPDKTISATN